MKKFAAASGAAFLVLACSLFFAPVRQVVAQSYNKMFSVWIQQSKIDSTPIGSTTPSAGAFTAISGPLTGNVTGNISGTTGTFTGTVSAGSFSGPLTGNVTGNVSGNAGTATAFAATPGKCSGTGLAQGVSANGTAVGCTSSTYLVQGAQIAGCTTPSGTFGTCNVTVTWPANFADSSYFATCIGEGASDPRAMVEQASLLAPNNVVVTTVTLGGTAVSFSLIQCIGFHP
jgi:hypothetical protein